MRTAGGAVRMAAVAVAGLVLLAGCGGAVSRDEGGKDDGAAKGERPGGPPPGAPVTVHPETVPGIGTALRSRIPADSGQVVAVYGRGPDSADSTVVLYEKHAKGWDQQGSWTAHNGRRGWTVDHHEDDKRSPVGVFTLTDAGGVLANPGTKLPYTHSSAFTPPSYWPKNTRNDFDYVIAINYNRVKGISPLDPTRPEGRSKGGGIWLHMDHGGGTSGCVSVSKAGMRSLLRALDPARHPVVVMGDKAHLAA
ncbi:L,D-transpeptidase family protein [Streptomyces sp. NPDC001339]|uniref:L,D-transpeptidase family protein n=1 Tax=Streptomyces sp. NPDC001339 TaxID=3364563 RepID=UPI0036846326